MGFFRRNKRILSKYEDNIDEIYKMNSKLEEKMSFSFSIEKLCLDSLDIMIYIVENNKLVFQGEKCLCF